MKKAPLFERGFLLSGVIFKFFFYLGCNRFELGQFPLILDTICMGIDQLKWG